MRIRFIPAVVLAACGQRPQPIEARVAAPVTASPLAAIGLRVPPHQEDPWTPAVALPAELSAVVATLFDQGLADPRGLDYRAVDLVIGNVDTGGELTVSTHAWLFERDRFAVAWNGVVYPVARVGGAASVHRDAALLAGAARPRPTDREPVEPDEVAADTPGVAKLAILVRLGEEASAIALWNAIPDDRTGVVARAAASTLQDHAISSRARGDHETALAYSRAFALVAAGANLDRRDVPARLIADELPRVKAARPPLPDPSALAAMTDAARLAALIDHLDEIRMFPVGLGTWSDRDFIPELIKLGAQAIDPLIAVIESDPRLTRTAARDGDGHVELLGVEEAAYQAITAILSRNFFREYLDGRAQLAAAIRAYWVRWRDLPIEERWYLQLADDHAEPHDQVMAALELSQPSTNPQQPGLRGEVLRSHAAPSVSTLIERRIDATTDLGDACYFAQAYHQWDIKAANPAVKRVMARAIAETGTDDRHGRCISDLAKLRADAGDLAGVDDYAHWIVRTVPGKDYQSTLMFATLSAFMTRRSVVHAVDDLFRDGSPWVPLADPTGAHADVSDLLSEPLLAMPAVNKQAIAGLADDRAFGSFEMKAADRYIVNLTMGGGVESVVDPKAPDLPPVGTRRSVRVRDWIAYRVTNYRSQAPAFELYWSDGRRDAAIAALTRWVKAQAKP